MNVRIALAITAVAALNAAATAEAHTTSWWCMRNVQARLAKNVRTVTTAVAQAWPTSSSRPA